MYFKIICICQLLFETGSGNNFKVLRLSNCDEICPLAEYLRIVNPILPTDDGTACLYENARNNVENIINGETTQGIINDMRLKYL